MTLVAAVCVGAFCALAAASLMGTMPSWRPPRRRVRRVRFEHAAASVGASSVAFVTVAALTGSAFVALVPAVAVGAVPRAYFAREARRRASALQRAWPDGLRDLVASIASGRSLTQGLQALATGGPPPLREAFARFPDLARVLGTGPALEVVRAELADATSDRVIEVLLVAHERGGAIVRTILEDLVDATTRDLKLRDEIETEGLEMRINARVVVVMPWLVLVVLTARAGPFRDFYRTSGGLLTLLVAAGLTAIGVFVLGRLGRETVEARVFGS